MYIASIYLQKGLNRDKTWKKTEYKKIVDLKAELLDVELSLHRALGRLQPRCVRVGLRASQAMLG